MAGETICFAYEWRNRNPFTRISKRDEMGPIESGRQPERELYLRAKLIS